MVKFKRVKKLGAKIEKIQVVLFHVKQITGQNPSKNSFVIFHDLKKMRFFK